VQQSSLYFLADLAYNIGMFLDCVVCFFVLPNEFTKLLTVLQEEIFASSFAAAAYLKSINFPSDKKVYVVGEAGIQLELKQAGISYIGGPEDGDKKIDLAPGHFMEHDQDVGAVVVGFDRNINYYKLQ
jgi:phosphoglycolate phosphatase